MSYDRLTTSQNKHPLREQIRRFRMSLNYTGSHLIPSGISNSVYLTKGTFLKARNAFSREANS